MHGAARCSLAHLVGMDTVEPSAVRISPVRVMIRERRRITAGVPLLATRRTCLTADARVEIDHQAELAVGCIGESGHGPNSRLPKEAKARPNVLRRRMGWPALAV